MLIPTLMFKSSINWRLCDKQVNFLSKTFKNFKQFFKDALNLPEFESAQWLNRAPKRERCAQVENERSSVARVLQIEVKRFWNSFWDIWEFRKNSESKSSMKELEENKLNCPHWTMTLILERLEHSLVAQWVRIWNAEKFWFESFKKFEIEHSEDAEFWKE